MATQEGTPVRAGAAAVPYGHVIGSEKWRGSELAQLLQGKLKLVFEDSLGLVDFHLSNSVCILYISEADLVAGSAFKRRLVRFRKASNLKGIVIAEKTRLSEQYFPPVQKFVVLELGMAVLPVTGQSEAAQLIAHLVQEQSRERGSNPFTGKKHCPLLDSSVLQTVQQIPGVGRVKALQLLQVFPSIQQLSNASLAQLESVIGKGGASSVHAFFTKATEHSNMRDALLCQNQKAKNFSIAGDPTADVWDFLQSAFYAMHMDERHRKLNGGENSQRPHSRLPQDLNSLYAAAGFLSHSWSSSDQPTVEPPTLDLFIQVAPFHGELWPVASWVSFSAEDR
ncbi:Fanconi anemia core complex-associated protein 24 [Gastrophryne carolinensis]